MNPWIMAIRPKTLFASIAPVLLGLSLANNLAHQFNLLIAVLTLICALLLQMASNLANDYLDGKTGIDNEERLGPTRVTHAGLLSETHIRNALIFLLILSFSLGCYLMYVGGPLIIFFGLISVYFAYGYTGGPYPLSHNGLGEVAAFIFFGVIAVTGTYFLQTHELSMTVFAFSFGPGFISATILAINNLRDIKSDSKTHKKTIAVMFGEYFQRRLCLFLIMLSSVVVIFLSFVQNIYQLIGVALLPLLFSSTWKKILMSPIDQSFNLALAQTAKYLLLYCVSISIILYFYPLKNL